MDHNRDTIKLADIIDSFIEENRLPYEIIHETLDGSSVGVRDKKGGSWIAWIYETEIKSYWNEELICLKASDPDFFPMLIFWFAFNNARLKDMLKVANAKR